MASLRVKSVHNLGEIRNCGLAYSPSRKKGFVNYGNNDRGDRRVPRLIMCAAADVVSRNFRSDSHSATSCSSGSSFSSVFDRNCSQLRSLATSITGDHRRRKDDVKEEDFSGKLDKWVKESVVEVSLLNFLFCCFHWHVWIFHNGFQYVLCSMLLFMVSVNFDSMFQNVV